MGLICFDLFGTLVDPLRAMEHSVALTCQELGLPVPARADVARFIGFPPRDLVASLPGLQGGQVDAALATFWAHYESEGLARQREYEGIPLMLTRLKRQGHALYLVTVQPTKFARRVLHEFDLLLCFEEVAGSSPQDAHPDKGEILARLRSQGVALEGGYMVGDRGQDMEAAKAAGLTPVGVTYGYGGPAELQGAGAQHLFGSPTELDAWFRTRFPGAEIRDAFSLSE
ncbi:MAG TPA: HAD hydrolase-like protein [Holophaga sp.]|nr:HAD hydrolase-like protein [Holophaga sp.]